MKSNCIFQCIATVIGFFATVDRAAVIRGTIGQRLTDNGWHVPGINQRDVLPFEIETGLSIALGWDVRYIGIWDSNLPGLSKRDPDAVPRYIFGTKIQGHDYHFTYMGVRNNITHFRIGTGPGPRTGRNQRRLAGRSDYEYNNRYFGQGGIDFLGALDPAHPTSSGESLCVWMDASNAPEFTWIVDKAACYMSSFDSLTGSPMSHGALNFQVYNYFDRETLAAGAVAPFTADGLSAIAQAELKGGLPENKGHMTSKVKKRACRF
ncbi:hypothetical protein F4677DRAFT_415024 [Hypoxylon crocopeplum]|nr:hypothetical protein F4677DRAFT_415024 [Hypoxylon crocopeplum]